MHCITEYCNDLIILDDFERAGDYKAEGVDALADVEDEVSGRTVRGLKLHGERAQAAVAGQTKRRVVVEHLPVQVDADVCSHVFGTNGENLQERG